MTCHMRKEENKTLYKDRRLLGKNLKKVKQQKFSKLISQLSTSVGKEPVNKTNLTRITFVNFCK